MLGSTENVAAIHSILQDYPAIPLVLDPVLATGQGTSLGERDLAEAIRTLLLPHATVITPNSPEARSLAPGADSLDACALALLDLGADHVLVTGAHEATPHVVNTLYHARRKQETFTWERLPHSYHGSGCTLAAAIAGLLAHGLDVFGAVHEAQEFTWNALNHGYRPGMGQYLPNRLYWSGQDQ
jgi:hydroxymethylpyrimidine/phosphomethylpyrimidine kinase